MTDPKGNDSEFCFPETRRNKSHCFPRDQSLGVLLPLNSKIKKRKEKNCEEIVCLTPFGSQSCIFPVSEF